MTGVQDLVPTDLMCSLPTGLQSALTAYQTGDMTAAEALTREALQDIDSADHRLMFVAHYLQLRTLSRSGDNAALRHGLQLISRAEALNRNDCSVLAHAETGELYRLLGMANRAITHFRESLRFADPADATQLAIPLMRLGLAYLDIGNPAEALTRLERARHLFQSWGNQDMTATALLAEANALRHLGQNREAIDRLEVTENLIQKSQDRKHLTAVHRAMASAYSALGETDQAADSLALATALHGQGFDPGSAGLTALELARFRFENDDLEAAADEARMALQQFRGSADFGGQARSLRLLSVVQEAAGDTESALESLRSHLALRSELADREGDRLAAVRIMQLEQSLAQEQVSARRTQRALLETNRELRKRSEQLEQLAQTDPLTGLYNRRHLTDVLENAFRAETPRPLTLMLFDIDDFKGINDTFGHATGDQVLRQLSDLIRNNLPPDMVAARWGGEEFAVAMQGTDIRQGAVQAARLQESIETNDWSDVACGLTVRISTGLAARSEPAADSLKELLRLADDRMYTAKNLP